jgi:hypothetical protein
MPIPLSMTMVPEGTKTMPPAGRMVIAPFPNPETVPGFDCFCWSEFVPISGRIGFAVGWIGDPIGAIRFVADENGAFCW